MNTEEAQERDRIGYGLTAVVGTIVGLILAPGVTLAILAALIGLVILYGILRAVWISIPPGIKTLLRGLGLLGLGLLPLAAYAGFAWLLICYVVPAVFASH